MVIKKPLFSGKVAFTLYDTYGFPLDLTQSILQEKGIEINIKEFEEEMAEQKKRAKEAWVGSGDIKNSKIYFDIKERIEPTIFVGYEKNTEIGKILSIIKDGIEVKEVKSGDEFEFFVNKTSFYGESGGQVGDCGLAIKMENNGIIPLPFTTIEITDVKRPFNNYFLHKGKVETGNLKVGEYLNLSINTERRNKIRANHSSLHLLQYALRQLFGENVMQKGSYVDENKGRFDFTLNKPIKKEEIKKIEEIVNNLIFLNTDVNTKIMNLEEAKNCGAMALFNEKYEDIVRVLFMGNKDENTKNDFNMSPSINAITENLNKLNNASLKHFCSIELCGGTHVSKTGEIGLFKIVSEESIASGIRRIESLTGLEALNHLNKFQDMIYNIDNILQVGIKDLVSKIQTMNEEYKIFKKQLDNMRKANMSSMTFTEENNKIMLAYSLIKDVNPKEVKGTIIDIQNKKYNSKSILVCITKFEKKLTILLAISKDLNDKLKANEIIIELVKIAGGNGGGGQPWFAMGGADDFENPKIITSIIDYVRHCSQNF